MKQVGWLIFSGGILLLLAANKPQKKTATPPIGKVCEVKISESSSQAFSQAVELAYQQPDAVQVRSVEKRQIIYISLKKGSPTNDQILKNTYEKAGIATDKITCMQL